MVLQSTSITEVSKLQTPDRRAELNKIRSSLLRRAEDARIRAQYQPTSEKQRQELERAESIEAHTRSQTIFGSLSD